MIIEYIRYTLTAHSPAELVAAYDKAGRYLVKSPECLGFELAQCIEDANSFILRIQWTSADDHLKGFRQGPQFPPFLAEIKPFISEITEMRHYQAMPNTTP